MAMAAALWQHVALGHLCQSLVFSSITLSLATASRVSASAA
jgi:hypothetical protein